MQPLQLLSAYLEEGSCTIAPSFVEVAHASAFAELRQRGALVASSQPSPRMCALCDRALSIERDGDALCYACGVVDERIEEKRLMPDLAWLMRAMAQALQLDTAHAWRMASEHLWCLGDAGVGAARRRILFVRQVTRPAVHRALHASLSTYLGDTPGIIITTTRPERIDGCLPLPTVWLPAGFRFEGDGLVADDGLWRAALRGVPVQAKAVHTGPFARDFRAVVLPGETSAIALTRKQGLLLRVLWEHEGARVQGDVLMRQIDSVGQKPVDLFKRANYPKAHRVYTTLVRNHYGDYWLPRDGAAVPMLPEGRLKS